MIANRREGHACVTDILLTLLCEAERTTEGESDSYANADRLHACPLTAWPGLCRLAILAYIQMLIIVVNTQ
jgi:hypothetical protein